MNYVLKGRISMDNPYSLDKTLTIEGVGADAKAVGDALAKKVNTADIANNLTTDDATKPLAASQGKVLDEKIDNAVSELEETINKDIGAAKQAAEAAQSTADSAKTIAESAQSYVDQLTFVKTVNGISPDEYGNVTLPSADEVSY